MVDMSNVNGYFTTTTHPGLTPPPPPAGWPAPVTVPVNTAPVYQPGYGQPGQADQYINAATEVVPYLAGAAPGKVAAAAVSESKVMFARAAKSRSASAAARASSAGRSALFGSVMGAIRSSVIINGVLSLGINGYKLFKKETTMADAGANVTGDMMSAVVGGAAGGVASAAGTFALAGILGTGLPLTLVGMGLGVAGYLVADRFLRGTKIFQDVTGAVRRTLA